MKHIAILLATGIMLICQSCFEIKMDKPSEINVQTITSKITEQIKTELDSINNSGISLTDTIAIGSQIADTSTLSAKISHPVIIKEIKVNIHEDKNRDYQIMREKRQYLIFMTALTGICSLTFVIIIAILVFLYLRIKNRNAIISKAIENGYNLPDTFYCNSINNINYNTNPKADSSSPTDENNDIQLPPPLILEQKQFDIAIKYLSAGIGIIAIFSMWSNAVLASLGIIPLLIGVGKLITYYQIGRK